MKRLVWRQEHAPLLLQTGARLELAGNREATVDGCSGVLVYTDSDVRVRYGRGILRFCGRGLTLRCLAEHSLIVTGYITGISYAARGELLPPVEEGKPSCG